MTARGRRRRFRIVSILTILAIGAIFYFFDHKRPSTVSAATEMAPANTTQPTTVPVIASTQPTTQAATEPTAAGDVAMAEGAAKLKADELLAGRKILNDVLVSQILNPNQTATAKNLLSSANQAIIFSPRHFPDDPYGGLTTVAPGQTLARIAQSYALTWNFLAEINGLTNPKHLRAGQTLKIIKGPFNAVVTKSAFTMDIWLGPPEQQGGMYISTYRVGLGQDDSTPTGTWIVEPSRKLRNPTYFSPRGQGIIEADDPKNPLGKYWIGLTGTEGQALGKMSYGIHGTIDPSSIGHMSSLGCIRLGDADITQVFQLLVEGKSVVIVRK